jgi:hypothetical protein
MDFEVLIGVKQLNLDVMEMEALNRNTPGHPNYRKWLTFEEVGSIRDNLPGSQAIESWLMENDVEITWVGVSRNYFKAKTTIGHWETLLRATFYIYEDQKDGYDHREVPRAETYSLPASIHQYVHAFFDVSELPPVISHHSVRRDGSAAVERSVLSAVPESKLRSRKLSSACSGQSTIQCLDSIYDVGSNLGSASATQAVFETSNEAFSQSDLTTFQKDYHCTVQAALDVDGYETASCNTNDDYDSCFEGNLDIQYIMGMAQLTISTYYHVPDNSENPFVSPGSPCFRSC